MVALVLGQSLGIFPLISGEEMSDKGQEASLCEVCKFPERITALCWISYAGVKPDDHYEDLSVTFADAIVRLSSLSLRSVVRYQLQTQLWGQPGSAPPLSYNIWDLHKSGPRSAGVCAGLKPPSLYGTLTGRDTNQKILLLTSGRDPALAAFEAEEVLQRGSLAFVSNLASSVASGVLGIARAAVVGRQSGYRAGLRNWVAAKTSMDQLSQAGPSKTPKEEDLPKGEPVTLFRSLRDGPRVVDQLLLAPRGPLAVGRDSFGRVLLIDIISLTVIRVWKSYRDAQAGWILGNVANDTLTRHQPDSNQQHASLHAWSGHKRRADSTVKQDNAASNQQEPNLYLVLYAPRKRSLELWQMRHGQRIASAQVPPACKLLQRVVPFGLQFELSDLSGHRLSIGQVSGVDQCLILDIHSGQSMDVLDALQRA